MNRIVLLGVLGAAVIAAALALNYAINREEPALPQISEATAPESGAVPDTGEAIEPVEPPAAAESASTASATGTGTGSAAPESAADEPDQAATATPEAAADGSVPPAEPDTSTQTAAIVGAETPSSGDSTGAAQEAGATTATGAETGGAEGDQPQAGAAEPMAPEFDIVRVNPTGEAVIAGRASPGSEVTVMSGDQPIGTATADERGDWVVLPEQRLQPGNHELSAVARMPDHEPMESADVVVVVVPEPQKDIAGEKTEATGQALALAVPREGEGRATVLQAPGASREGIGDNNLFLDSVDYGEKGDVSIGGRADPGADLQVYLDNRLLGTAEANPEGHWQLTPEQNVSEGLHDLRVDQVGEGGTVVARVETPFQRMELTDWPAQKVVVVQPGNSLWRLARRMYGAGVRYTVIYEANRSQIGDPDLIFPGQVFVVPPGQAAPKADAATGLGG